MKKLLALFCTLAVTLTLLAVPAAAVGYDPSATYAVQAASAYVVNTDTNVILYEKNSEQQMPAKGLTKLMCAALVLTNYKDVLDTTTFQMTSAVSDYVYNTDYADLRPGETFTVREALYAMLLRNANDAAMGMAYQLSGNDLTGWVSQMNSLSQKIGTTGSTWTDACGISDGNVTTARDMYLIERYLMDFDAFKEIEKSSLFVMPAKEKHAATSNLLNVNVMVNQTSGGQYYRSAVQGGTVDVKGYKADSGTQSCVSWATQDGATYIFSIMGSPDTCDTYGYDSRRPALFETTKLVDWVFGNFTIQSALDTTQPLCEVKVEYATNDSLLLYPADDLKTILPSASDSSATQKVYNLPDKVYAPVKQGDVVGSVTLVLAGESIGTVDLLAGQDVQRNPVLFAVSRLTQFFSSLYFKVVVVLSLLCFLFYVGWFLYHAYINRNDAPRIRRR